jgi:hypothetical protein
MRKRFYFFLLVLAVLLFALPGLTARGIKGITRYRRRLGRRLPGSLAVRPASRLGS